MGHRVGLIYKILSDNLEAINKYTNLVNKPLLVLEVENRNFRVWANGKSDNWIEQTQLARSFYRSKHKYITKDFNNYSNIFDENEAMKDLKDYNEEEWENYIYIKIPMNPNDVDMVFLYDRRYVKSLPIFHDRLTKEKMLILNFDEKEAKRYLLDLYNKLK